MAGNQACAHAGSMQKTSDILWQDQQHQELFRILDLMAEPGSGTEVLTRLRDYTAHHFALEEAYMKALAYPETEQHIRAHDKFREEIRSACESGGPHDALFMELMSTFLREWLKRHVFGVDKRLERYLLASAVR